MTDTDHNPVTGRPALDPNGTVAPTPALRDARAVVYWDGWWWRVNADASQWERYSRAFPMFPAALADGRLGRRRLDTV